MAIQEWFYLHPWAKILYFILGLPMVYSAVIIGLRFIFTMIVRLPHSLSGSVETKQGLSSREEIK